MSPKSIVSLGEKALSVSFSLAFVGSRFVNVSRSYMIFCKLSGN